MIRLLITGSRTWTDAKRIENAIYNLWQYDKDITIVHGDCPSGADHIADLIAINQSLEVERYPADWTYGKRAGFVRNKQMVDTDPDQCYAFIKDDSKGATMCAKLASERGIPTYYFRE